MQIDGTAFGLRVRGRAGPGFVFDFEMARMFRPFIIVD